MFPTKKKKTPPLWRSATPLRRRLLGNIAVGNRADGKGLYEALVQETKRLKNTRWADGEYLETQLELLIQCHHLLLHGPIHRTQPRLSLSFADVTGRGAIDQRFPKALKALVALLMHSFWLNKFPKLEVKLWWYVLCSVTMRGSDNCEEPDVEDWIWVAEDESFPMFV